MKTCECCHFVPISTYQWCYEHGHNISWASLFLLLTGKKQTDTADLEDLKFEAKKYFFCINIDWYQPNEAWQAEISAYFLAVLHLNFDSLLQIDAGS